MLHRLETRSPPQPLALLTTALWLAACQAPPDERDPAHLSGDDKIVAGQAASADEAKVMAAFFLTKVLFDGSRESRLGCGGTFIAPDLVLTASHCVVQDPAYRLSVGNGRRRLSDHLVDQQFVAGANGAGVAAYWLHPKYDHEIADYDVALVKLDRPLPGARLLPFIDSEQQERQTAAPGTSSTVLGWGAVDKENSLLSNELRRGTIPILDRRTCERKAEALDYPFSDVMMCAGGGRTDTCGGDSGGPLLVKGANGQPTVAGVTSFGILDACAINAQPGYYSRMATLGSWVRGCMNDPRRCAGDGGTRCRVDGDCKNEAVKMGVLPSAHPAHLDRAACLRQAREVSMKCQNDASEGDRVWASFADAAGTKVAQFPACLVEGPCVESESKRVWQLFPFDDEAQCLATAERVHSVCKNNRELPVTATFFHPDRFSTRTHPSR